MNELVIKDEELKDLLVLARALGRVREEEKSIGRRGYSEIRLTQVNLGIVSFKRITIEHRY